MSKNVPIEAQMKISTHLEAIERMFKAPKVTLVIRNPELEDGDLIVTNDNFEDAIEAIKNLKDRKDA